MKIMKLLPLATLALGIGFGSSAIAAENMSMTVYKSPWCGCCEAWSNAMVDAGYSVKTIDLEDLSKVKAEASVTDELAGCHTAVFGDYILEGHVPLEAIYKLIAEKPDIRGLAAPGMPTGSLGMGEDPDAQYTVYAFSADTSQTPTVYYEVGQ